MSLDGLLHRATVSEPVLLTGDSFEIDFRRLLTPGELKKKAQMTVFPAQSGQGVLFAIKGKEEEPIPFDIFHAYGLKYKVGSRLLALSSVKDVDLTNLFPKNQGLEIYLVEHIGAALHAAGITDATVVIEPSLYDANKAFVPSDGPGMVEHYCRLREKRLELPEKRGVMRVKRFHEHQSYDGKGKHVFKVQPADSLQFTIKESDLGAIRLHSKKLKLNNVHQEIVRHAHARPVARLDSWGPYLGWHVVSILGWKGIRDGHNYLIGRPWSSHESITKDMHLQYQDRANEQLGHGAVDLYGEMFMFHEFVVTGKYVIKQMNHVTRVRQFKELYREGFFSFEKP